MTTNDNSHFQEEVNCFNCKNPIGNIVLIQGVEVIQIGSLIETEAHGFCAHCGFGFHWSSKVELLRKVMADHSAHYHNRTRTVAKWKEIQNEP